MAEKVLKVTSSRNITQQVTTEQEKGCNRVRFIFFDNAKPRHSKTLVLLIIKVDFVQIAIQIQILRSGAGLYMVSVKNVGW